MVLGRARVDADDAAVGADEGDARVHRVEDHGVQVGVLAACVAALSAFVKNVGALAIFIPVAFQVAARNDRSCSY